jgi:hypothetical protein
MKTRYALLLLFPMLLAFSWYTPKKGYPTIVLSEKYGRVGENATLAKTYYIKPTAGLYIDPTKMSFENIRWMNYKKMPTKIFLMAEGVMYTMPFTHDKIMLADAAHLYNMEGIKPFDGFKVNSSFLIGVGEVEIVEEKVTVKTCWATLVKVK